MAKKIERIGETNYNKYGSKMTIIEYKDVHNLVVEFENGYKIKAQYTQFKKGNIISPYDKTIFNIGYLGEGKYKTSIDNEHTLQYLYWSRMMCRCYSSIPKKSHKTYKDCLVCEEWLNFQNFAEWFDKNYYEIDEGRMELDKDILVKGNKIYSPEACIFVPKRINTLFVKCDTNRGEYPIGVNWHKGQERFVSRCQTLEKRISLGYYDTPEEAFEVYKTFKENYIKQVADEYKNQIPKELYDALYRYKVEITD